MKGQQGALLPCLLPGRPPGFETHAPYEVSRVQFVDPSLSHPSRWSRARWPPKCQKQGWASRPEFRVLGGIVGQLIQAAAEPVDVDIILSRLGRAHDSERQDGAREHADEAVHG